jgi:hypothetical protein
MWEIDRYDWRNLRAQGTADRVPEAIMQLVRAKTQEEAEGAYWKIDNTVVVQGALHESAVPTARCLVIGLQQCTAAARPRILELLVQLAGGEPSREELARGNDSLARHCVRELYLAAGCFLALFETGTEEEKSFCVDLLGLCAREYPELRSRVHWYLTRYAKGVLNELMRKLVASWIAELG